MNVESTEASPKKRRKESTESNKNRTLKEELNEKIEKEQAEVRRLTESLEDWDKR